MGARKALNLAVGLIQGVMGALIVILAYFLYHDFFGVQSLLRKMLGETTTSSLPLYILLLFTTGTFSVISGLVLINEWRRF